MTDKQIKELAEKTCGSLKEFLPDGITERFEEKHGREMTEQEMIDTIRATGYWGIIPFKG